MKLCFQNNIIRLIFVFDITEIWFLGVEKKINENALKIIYISRRSKPFPNATFRFNFLGFNRVRCLTRTMQFEWQGNSKRNNMLRKRDIDQHIKISFIHK